MQEDLCIAISGTPGSGKTSLSKLFESNDAILIIKLKDIYESLETASDRCVDVADVVEDIVLKYT